MSQLFGFYKTFYPGYLTLEEIEEATKWGCITKKEFKEITNKDYKE
ncbi:XkdX family protein [Clostridium botulinum]|nr:XkdX family protein [Clostridium botulinum]MBN3352653.1 hypothetical protein [Clostridium botulinum]MBN3360165.1 hypothetical protein [Clostridium botulinum]MCC5424864.1 XkdX family protein [Clostridium botulinum]NFM82643.1 XkdX family protein [Clostridium botulinum]NFP12269.1 XkdX family protein [Clostridium botulinum]